MPGRRSATRGGGNRAGMKRLVQAGALAVVLIGIATVAAQSPAADVTFRGLIDAKNIGEYMRLMAARPHHLGSPYGKQNADWILARFKEWGWDAHIETYDVLFPTPKERVLELLGPTPFKAVARRSRRSPSIRPRRRSPSSCRRSTPTPWTATSPDRSSTSTTDGRPTTRSSRAAASRSRARSSSRATGSRGAASSPRWPPSTARSAA